MAIEIGEAREAWGWDVWRKAEDICQNTKASKRPFYIVYAAKADRGIEDVDAFRQTFKMYKAKPPKMLGILVWHVNKEGDFSFVSELSLPPDVPLDPNLLSTKSSDMFASVAEQGSKANVLLS
jgi:hypothetical protein